MKEKFKSFDEEFGGDFLKQEGEFLFTVQNAELAQNKKGGDQIIIECKSDAGSTKLWMQLQDKTLWNYRRFIAACLQLSKDQLNEKMGGDKLNEKYLTIHNELIDKQFIGISKKGEPYKKVTNEEQPDGTIVPKETIVEGGYRVDTYYPNI